MKAVAFAALALSLVGTLFAVGMYSRVRATPPAPATGGTGAEIEALKARISRLETEMAQAKEGRAAPTTSAEPSHDHGPAPGELAELKKRVEALERRSVPLRNEPGRNMAPNPAAVEYHKKRLLDATAPGRTRATALGMLRTQGANKADDVVDAALGLLAQATEANLRALILRNLRGAENNRLIQAVVSVLKSDADEDVRDEAARVLGEYVGQPEAKSALEQAAVNDASDKVKRQANAALSAPPAPRR